jgi:hypothetical protein
MPDPHVTIPDEDPIIQYTVTSADDEFTFPFSFFDNTDILVYNGDDLIAAADYTVVGNSGTSGGYDGGTVTLDTAVSNTVLTILRQVPASRTTDFPTSGPFNISALNTQLDKSFAIQQQQNLSIDRAIKIPDTDDPNISTVLASAADRANKALIFDEDGVPTVSENDYNDDASAIATAAATAAAASATAAAASETSAAEDRVLAQDALADTLEALADAETMGDMTVDQFTGDGVRTTDTLTVTPESENNTWVYFDGVYQQKDSYSVAADVITYGVAPGNGVVIEVVTGSTLPLGALVDSSVTTSKINDLAVTAGKLATDAVETAKIKDNNVTLAKLATQDANTVLVNATGSAAVPTAMTVAASKLVGRGSAGNITQITPNTGLVVSTDNLNVDVGTTANKIVQLDASARLPAVDGSQLLNVPAGAMVFLGQQVASNDATLDFTSLITSDYDTYIFDIIDLLPASDTELRVRTSTNNGSSFDSGASNYFFHNSSYPIGGANTSSDSDGTALKLTEGSYVGNGAGEGISGRMMLIGPLGTTRRKLITFEGMANNSSVFNFVKSYGYRDAASDIDAVRFLMSSGNIVSGRINMYGVKNS